MTAAALALLATLVACVDEKPLEPPVQQASGEALGVRLDCRVEVAAGRLECEPASAVGDGMSALIIGGQNHYVRLTSTNVVSNGGVLSADVTVENLTAQPMATADGTTPDDAGVRVFFHTGPSNGVEVANPDGIGTFTAAAQPYHEYSQTTGLLGGDGLLSAGETTAAKQWQFTLNGQSTFTFSVYLATEMAGEGGVLRWDVAREPTVPSLYDIWAVSPTLIYATSGRDVVRYDGTSWQVVYTGSQQLYAIWGSSESDIYAVGDVGTLVHFDGSTWTSLSSGTTATLYGVGGTSGTDVFVLGSMGTMLHWDGSSWSAIASGTSAALFDVWGTSPTNLFVVGTNGTILHHDGTSWSTQPSGTTENLWTVWGVSDTEVYAGGFGSLLRYDGDGWSPAGAGLASNDYVRTIHGVSGSAVFAVGHTPGGEGLVWRNDGTGWSLDLRSSTGAFGPLWVFAEDHAIADGGGFHRYDGSAWTLESSEWQLTGLWATPGGEVFASTRRHFWYFDGGSWVAQALELGELDIWDVAGTSSSDVFAVGWPGKILHFDGTSWSEQAQFPISHINAVWAVSPSDVFAVGWQGEILHYDGSGWAQQSSPATSALYGVWGATGDDVWAVGDGGLFHYDGEMWTASGVGSGLRAVHGSSPGNVFAVGINGTILHYDGSAWSPMSSGTTAPLSDVWAGGPSRVYVTGNLGGDVLYYDGASWSRLASPAAELHGNVFGISGAATYVLGYNRILRGTR